MKEEPSQLVDIEPLRSGKRRRKMVLVGAREERPTQNEALVTVAEYQAIRADPTRFAVLPGRELPEVESVVKRHPTYLVVEKREAEAREIARETDPRS